MTTVTRTRYEVSIDRNLCVGCGNCDKVCPVGVFDIIEGKALANRAELCMGCQLCEVECPTRAIVIGRPIMAAPAGTGAPPPAWQAQPVSHKERAIPQPVGVTTAPVSPATTEWPSQQPPPVTTLPVEAPLRAAPAAQVGGDWPVSAAPAPPPAPPATAPAIPSPPFFEEGRKPANKKLYAVKDLCVGCRICEVMCSLKHNATSNPYRARLKITLPQGNAYNFTPIICHHCTNPPPCMQACPVNAFYIDPNTEVAVIDSSKCISCMACVHACPFGAIQVGPDQREILKCDLCGGDPACVKYCADRPENLLPHRPYPRTSVLRYDEPHKIAELTRQLHTSKV